MSRPSLCVACDLIASFGEDETACFVAEMVACLVILYSLDGAFLLYTQRLPYAEV